MRFKLEFSPFAGGFLRAWDMSKEAANSLELSSIPRSASANRFQVNLVNKNLNGAAAETPEDEDQFNENEAEMIKQRRTSRLQSIKSSFRDSKKERKESIARFKVDDNSDSNDEDENLLDGNEYDTKYGRSFRWVEHELISLGGEAQPPIHPQAFHKRSFATLGQLP